RPETPFLLTTLGRLWMAGIEVDWRAFHSGEMRRRVPLPTYPFERRRYWIEGAGPLGIGRGAARRPSLEKRSDPADWLSAPTWKRGLPVPPAVMEPRHWLLVLDEGGVGERLAGLLRAAGHEVATAPPAGSREAYAALFAEPPRSVVHLAGLDEAEVFHDLIALAQGLGDAGPVDLTVVASGLFDVTGGESLSPEKATLFGPARVIPWEYPHVSCRVLDAGRVDPEILLREIVGGEGSLVALRGPHRWVPGWEPLRLDAAPVQPLRIREDGVYLITGGTGGIGLEIAVSLAQGRKVRLALLGRTLRRSCRILDLEKMGAEILVLSADVADRAAMKKALAEVRGRFGAIHGVVHAAGVPGGALIQRHTPAESERVLAPRIGGLRVLADLLSGEPLDFFVLTSAAGALSGEPGQVDLTAAGAFLDAWAQSRSGRPGPYTVSIDWDTWREVGMAADVAGLPEPLRRARAQALATGIAPAEGREVFARILERAVLPQVVVSTKDLNAVLEHLSALSRGAGEETAPARSTYARPELKSAYAEPRDATERALAAIWQDLLGLERVGIDDNFFDLGGHSLLATQVVSRVHEELGADVSLEAFFEAPTISGFARAVASHAAPSEEDALEALLREIEGLSPEEADEAYAQESHERL
ncbi:MAG TPA: SDR family NAD(P)-dependent oxidoreductase, partial [Thermoanaerobaculia bacterium]|nr:SDR family NAD(P)-dependent oxidoreductase [Thermoanaerobaculia bacterium]